MVCREFMMPLRYGKTHHSPTGKRLAWWIALVESASMPQRKLFRLLLLAGLGLMAGFIALAIAVAIEPQTVAPVIALFSPGLKLAELITPESSGKSFAWTFGWFLRIAIAANAIFYFAVFSLVAYLAGRRRSR